MPRAASSPLARVRRSAPSFFVRDEGCFVNYLADHHDEAVSRSGALALRACAMDSSADPEQYFVPPYVGFRGWIGARLDRDPGWNDVERVKWDAYLAVAPKKLVAAFLDR